MSKRLKPIHPGEVLLEEFIKPFKISQYRLAKDINVPAIRINQIIKGKRSISANTALRLSKYFQTTPEFWLNLQSNFDLVKEENEIYKQLDKLHVFEGAI